MTPKQREAQDALLRHGTQEKAAAALGISRSSLRDRLSKAKLEVQAPAVLSLPAGAVKVTVVGDTHDDPRQSDKSRFFNIGRHAADAASDCLVQLGDMSSFDSLNSHIDNASKAGKNKRALYSDFLSLGTALDELNSGLGSHGLEKHLTKGNHERRINAYENAHPEMENLLVAELDDLLSDRGWSSSEFGQFHFIEGVAFVHVPLNKMGKPYGGKTSMIQIANDAICDIVFGNSHNNSRVTIPKLGGAVTVVNAGCALPQGHVEGYARRNLTGWWWGVMDLVIAHGRIISVSETSMAELDARYSDRLPL